MSNKPDWADAPEWAKYLAQDKDGEWNWFEFLPDQCSKSWDLARCVGRSEKATKEAWTLTLESR